MSDRNKLVTLFTNAPASYDWCPQAVEAGVVNGCRVIDVPEYLVEDQILRNRSGLYWATTNIEQAAYLRSNFPMEAS